MMLTRELRAMIRSRRGQVVEIDGKPVPGSIPFIRELLAATGTDEDRDALLVELAGEYLRAGFDDEHVLIQRERVSNHPDVAITWLGLSHALSMRNDSSEEAKQAVAKAVDLSYRSGALVRYSLQCQADVARKTNDSALFERALTALIADAHNPRQEDSGLDLRIVENLPEGFCHRQLETQYRSLLENES
jgi:hypothetical protein